MSLARLVPEQLCWESCNPFTPLGSGSMMSDIVVERTKFFSTADIARLLSVDASTVKRWADSGKIRCFRTIGGHRRFSFAQVQEFIATYHLEGIASRGSLLQ